jgi:hypothetical protein
MIDDDLGSISPVCLCAASLCADPKSVKTQTSCKYLFALMGSAHIKAARKMLMKLTPVDHGTTLKSGN